MWKRSRKSLTTYVQNGVGTLFAWHLQHETSKDRVRVCFIACQSESAFNLHHALAGLCKRLIDALIVCLGNMSDKSEAEAVGAEAGAYLSAVLNAAGSWHLKEINAKENLLLSVVIFRLAPTIVFARRNQSSSLSRTPTVSYSTQEPTAWQTVSRL